MESTKFYFQHLNQRIAISQWNLEQIYNSESQAEIALKKRKMLTKVLLEKNQSAMAGNQRAIGNAGGDISNLTQFDPQVQKLKNAKIKRAKELYNQGYRKSEILRMIIKEFKLERNMNSRSWPKWLVTKVKL